MRISESFDYLGWLYQYRCCLLDTVVPSALTKNEMKMMFDQEEVLMGVFLDLILVARNREEIQHEEEAKKK